MGAYVQNLYNLFYAVTTFIVITWPPACQSLKVPQSPWGNATRGAWYRSAIPTRTLYWIGVSEELAKQGLERSRLGIILFQEIS